MSGDNGMVDITFANNVSVIPSTPSQRQTAAAPGEKNVTQPRSG